MANARSCNTFFLLNTVVFIDVSVFILVIIGILISRFPKLFESLL